MIEAIRNSTIINLCICTYVIYTQFGMTVSFGQNNLFTQWVANRTYNGNLENAITICLVVVYYIYYLYSLRIEKNKRNRDR